MNSGAPCIQLTQRPTLEHMKINCRRKGNETRKKLLCRNYGIDCWRWHSPSTRTHAHKNVAWVIVDTGGGHCTRQHHDYDSDNFIINYFYVSKFFSFYLSSAAASLSLGHVVDVWYVACSARLFKCVPRTLIRTRAKNPLAFRGRFFLSSSLVVAVPETESLQSTMGEAAVSVHISSVRCAVHAFALVRWIFAAKWNLMVFISLIVYLFSHGRVMTAIASVSLSRCVYPHCSRTNETHSGKLKIVHTLFDWLRIKTNDLIKI